MVVVDTCNPRALAGVAADFLLTSVPGLNQQSRVPRHQYMIVGTHLSINLLRKTMAELSGLLWHGRLACESADCRVQT